MNGTDEILAALRRYRDDAKSLGPVEFYGYVRQHGCKRIVAYVLLRDLYNKNLVECMQIERDAGFDDTAP